MTAHNLLAIERALRVAAERTITPERMELELEQVVGRIVRASSPCVACDTIGAQNNRISGRGKLWPTQSNRSLWSATPVT